MIREDARRTIQAKRKHVPSKNQLTANKDGYILHKVAHKKGRKHDYDVYKKSHPVIPKQVLNVVDLGYLGIEKDYQDQLSALPYRKEKPRFITRRKRR